MESDEVYDAVRDVSLGNKDPDVDNFGIESSLNLDECKNERDFRTTRDEKFMLVVGKLHEIHSFGNLGVKRKMESDCTWELDEPQWEGLWESQSVFVSFVGQNGVSHASEHRNDNKGYDERGIEHLSLLLRSDHIWFLILLQVAHDSEREEVLLVLKLILILEICF